MRDLAELQRKVESAEGPDRSIDIFIDRMSGPALAILAEYLKALSQKE